MWRVMCRVMCRVMWRVMCVACQVSDALGCRKVAVVLDTRTHPNQSLLHPGLAKFQGERLGLHGLPSKQVW